MNIVFFSDDDCVNPDCINGGCVFYKHDKSINNCFVFYKNDERYLHIKKVLHLKEGDVFKAGIINGKIGEAQISHLSEEKILFSFCPNKPDKVETRPLPLPPIKIILGFPRPIQLRRILRDAASLGFAKIVLCGTDLGERSYLKSNPSSPEEVKKYLLDGISQAGQTMLPAFSLCSSGKEALKN